MRTQFDGQEGTFHPINASAAALVQMDDKDTLAKAFGAAKGTDEALVAHVESEEGWILGV